MVFFFFFHFLSTELAKPANTLYTHNLSAILESAIRSTNAQYDKNEILNRLSVKLLEVKANPKKLYFSPFIYNYV